MAKTKIDWCDYTINCFWGCDNGCSYCQARSMAKRFGRRIGVARKYSKKTIEHMLKFEPVFLPDQLSKISKIKEPSKIFISFMGDAFADNYSHECLDLVLKWVKTHEQHTFIFLTKQPQNLVKWSPFSDNCWVGVSVTNDAMLTHAWAGLQKVEAKVKFVSIEPLLKWDMSLDDMIFTFKSLNWIIIGQQTPISIKTQPKIEWIERIIHAADKAHISVFLKENLRELLPAREPFWIPVSWYEYDKGAKIQMGENRMRQEFPRV